MLASLKNQKFDLADILDQTTKRLQKNQLVYFLTGYVLGASNLSPNEQNCIKVMQSIQGLIRNKENRFINNNNIFEILIQVIFKITKIPNKNEKMRNYIQYYQYLLNEIAADAKYIRDLWSSQKNIINEQANQDQATRKLIQQLQDQQKKQKLQQQKLNEKLAHDLIKVQKQELRKKKQQQDRQSMQCQICLEYIPTNQIGSLDCGHVFHKQCIKQHITACINQRKIDVPCPSGCGKILPFSDIVQFITKQTRQKFQQFCFDNYVQRNQSEVSWCPTPGCSAIFSFDQALDNYRCNVCKNHYCLKCRCKFHYGMSCAQYRINNTYSKQDQKFEKFIKGAKFKQCPHCNFWVQRVSGCSTMACKCGKQFCYDCGGTQCPHGSCNGSGKKKKR